MRPKFGDSRANAVGVGRQVERTERANLAPAGDAAVGFDFDDCAVEDRNRFASRPLVTALVERQFDPICADAFDFHSATPQDRAGWVGRVWMALRMIARIASRSTPSSGNRGGRTISEPSPVSAIASLMYCTSLT